MVRKARVKRPVFLVGILLVAFSVTVYVLSRSASDLQDLASPERSTSSLRSASVERIKLSVDNMAPYENILDNDEILEYPETVAELQNVSPLPFITPIDWNWKVGEDRTANFKLHSLENAHALVLMYEDTGRIELLDQALMIGVDWVEQNPYEPKNNQDGNFAWYDMAVGVRSYRLAFILEEAIARNRIEDEQIALLWNSLIDHFTYLEDEENYIDHNNHGLFQAAGQLAAARRLEEASPDAFRRIQSEASDRIRDMYALQFSGEGVHREHSPGYHLEVLSVFHRLLDAGLYDTDESLAAAADALYWMVKPNGELLNFGDTDIDQFTEADTSLLELYGTPLSDKAIAGLVDDSVGLQSYEDSGLSVYKSPMSYFAMQSAFFSRTHKHADDLGIVWYDRGEDIFIDAGSYGYLGKTERDSELFAQGFWYSDPNRVHVERTVAHNTVLIDDMDYVRKNAEPYGSALVDSGVLTGGAVFMHSQVTQFDAVEHDRIVVLQPGEWLFVYDALDDTNDALHDYAQVFNYAPGVEIDMATYGFTAKTPGSESLQAVSFQSDEVSYEGPFIGQKDPVMRGWHSPRQQVIQSNPSTQFQVQQKDEFTFATLFVFGEGDSITPVNLDGTYSWGSGTSVSINGSSDGEFDVTVSSQ